MNKTSIGSKPFILPTPVMVIGSYDKFGMPNIATAAWGGVISHVPKAYVNCCFRSETYTHDCIIESKAFTINFPSVNFLKETDYCGIYSGKDENKFTSLNLTAVKSTLVNAPYIEDFPLILECTLFQTVRINRHTQFIGEVQDVKIQTDLLDETGKLALTQLDPIIYSTADGSYYSIGKNLAKSYSFKKIKE